MSCWVSQLRPGHNFGISRPMRHPCQELELLCGQTKYSRRTPTWTLLPALKSRARAACANLSSHSWRRSSGRGWKRLGVHHQHRGRCTTKGTPVPRRSYCLNTAELEVWAVTTFASLTRRQHNTGRRAKIRRAVVIGNPERARPGGARRQHTHDTYRCRAYMHICTRE